MCSSSVSESPLVGRFLYLVGTGKAKGNSTISFTETLQTFSAAVVGLSIREAELGYGRHTYYLSFENIVQATKVENIATLLLLLSTMFTKISICVFLLRLFNTNRLRIITLYTIVAIIIVAHLTTALTLLLQCSPAAKLWNPTIKGTCRPPETQAAIAYFHGGTLRWRKFVIFTLTCAAISHLDNN